MLYGFKLTVLGTLLICGALYQLHRAKHYKSIYDTYWHEVSMQNFYLLGGYGLIVIVSAVFSFLGFTS